MIFQNVRVTFINAFKLAIIEDHEQVNVYINRAGVLILTNKKGLVIKAYSAIANYTVEDL